MRPIAPGEPPTTRHSTRERDEFPDFYADMDNAGTLFLVPGEKPMPPVTVRVVARGPVKSKGPEAINRQLDTFKAAIESSGTPVEEAFVAVLAPGWLDHFIFNEYYKTEEEFLFALADALREEYRAVMAAGFVLQHPLFLRTFRNGNLIGHAPGTGTAEPLGLLRVEEAVRQNGTRSGSFV